jgi:hypothetical protein
LPKNINSDTFLFNLDAMYSFRQGIRIKVTMENNSLWSNFLSQYKDIKGNKDNQDSKENKDKDKKLFSSVSNSRLELLRICLITIAIILGIAVLENGLKEFKPPTSTETTNQSQAEVQNDKQDKDDKDKDNKCAYELKFSTVICLIDRSKLLGQVQNVGVLSAAFLFFWDTRNRKKQLELQAWQLIDGAGNIKTSYARKQALAVLCREDYDFTGFDFKEMDFTEIDLTGANLTKASFKKAILNRAILKKAILFRTDFQEAELEEANLNHAYLYLANLEKAILHKSSLQYAVLNGANFQGAILRQANLQGANLQGANLQGANLLSTNLENANIENTDLRSTQNLNLTQVKKAKNWQKAIYDEEFSPEETQLIRKKLSKQEHDDQLISDIRNTNVVIKEIDKAIKIIDEENPEAKYGQLYQTLLGVRDKVNTLIDNKENYDISTKEKIRDELAKIQESQIKLDKARQDKISDKIAGDWLAEKQDNIISTLRNNHRLSLNENILDSPDKVEQFYQDINKILELFSDNISKSRRPKQIYDGTIKLQFQKFIYKDIFIIIVEQVIREMNEKEGNQLSQIEFNRLICYLNEFIKWLQNNNNLFSNS